ncbi:hypothetical protein BaRGS_00001253 [Batillaria attramentaria]|uniref:Uncharacterized protein n=1 Tax=Batillaria attramentaria TaxID=370345 RepID=A0ABD0M7X2_9CAEN
MVPTSLGAALSSHGVAGAVTLTAGVVSWTPQDFGIRSPVLAFGLPFSDLALVPLTSTHTRTHTLNPGEKKGPDTPNRAVYLRREGLPEGHGGLPEHVCV